MVKKLRSRLFSFILIALYAIVISSINACDHNKCNLTRDNRLLSFSYYDFAVDRSEFEKLEKENSKPEYEQRGDTIIAHFKMYYTEMPEYDGGIRFSGDTIVLEYCRTYNHVCKSEGIKLMKYRIYNPEKKKFKLKSSFTR